MAQTHTNPRPMLRRIAADAQRARMEVTWEGAGLFIRANRNRAVRIFPNGTAVRVGVDLTASAGMRAERDIRKVLGLRPEYRCEECDACQEWLLTPDQASPCTTRSPL